MKMKIRILGEVDVSQGEMLTQPSGNNAPDRLGRRRDDFTGQDEYLRIRCHVTRQRPPGLCATWRRVARGRRARSSM